MNSNVTRPICDLSLLPTESLRGFAVDDLMAYIRIKPVRDNRYPYASGATPGSIRVTDSGDNGEYDKKITYSRQSRQPWAQEELETLSRQNLIALYIDENGERRSCGTPEHPLALKYEEKEGVLEVELSGKGTEKNHFAVVSESFF